ncbi:MAG TPA: alpha-E domain-containing protein, partial [Panacibacter sp.]|nr:alpha-E domain-containing protein [Panacibacter sp.]
NYNSLKTILNRARENARGVQDHITKEVWEQVNQSYHAVNQNTLEESLYGYDVMNVLESFSRQTLLYTGVTDITMPRGLGWSFMNLGKYVERCMETIVMTDKQFEQIDYNPENTKDIIEWRYLLLCLSGYELHLKTYRTTAYNNNVLHQVLFNEDFTRSVIYSLSRIDKYLKDVVSEFNSPERAALLRSFGRLYSKVQYMDRDGLNNLTLQEFLAEIKDGLLNFSKQLGQSFFSYS